MQMIGTEDDDIMLDAYGQPVAPTGIDIEIIEGDDCWKQDLKNEVLTEEGELFYEDEEEDDAYGFGMLDFLQEEHDVEDEEDNFLITEIRQRISAKLSKRKYIDSSTIQTEIFFEENRIKISTSFKRVDDETLYSMDINVEDTGKVEVIIE